MPTSKSAGTKIVLDVEHPECDYPQFIPAGRKLHPTIRADRLKHQSSINPAINAVGEIPGERIEIDLADGKKGSATISHRWGFREYAERRTEFNKHISAMNATRIVDPAWLGTPHPPETYVFHSDDDKAYWLFWCRRLCDNGYLKLVSGELPELDEIKQMGNIRKCQNYGFQDPSISIMAKQEPTPATTE